MNLKMFSLTACLVLAACGGGGGGGGSGLVSVPLTMANFDATGRASAAALVDAGSSAATFAGLTSASTVGAKPREGALYLGKMAAEHAARALAARDQPAASYSETDYCPYGGLISILVNDNNNNDRADAGDSATLTFQSCVVDPGEPAFNGAVDITFQYVQLDSFNNLVAFDATVNFRQLVAGGSAINGAADFEVAPTRSTIVFRNASSIRRGVATVYNFTVIYDTASVYDVVVMNGEIGIGGFAYTLTTPTSIILGSVYPASGVLRVADSVGGRVDVVMGVSTFDIDLYLPGDNIIDGATTYSWTSLAAGTI